MTPKHLTAAACRLFSCHVCGLLLRDPGPGGHPRCTRCESVLHRRKRNSLQRSFAYLLAAAILYVPANVLPILQTSSVGYEGNDTIFSGIMTLWSGGSWPLALLVLFASILVPTLKFAVLGFLLLSTHRGWSWGLHDRMVLYRLIEFIGRWSMLDIFVVALTVSLVQLRGIATIHAGAGALAFASVVILMMYAAQAFDPRLMWDRAGR
jgi:paraquat-inducible protein A